MIVCKTEKVHTNYGFQGGLDDALLSAIADIGFKYKSWNIESVSNYHIIEKDGETFVTVFFKLIENQQHSQPCQCPLCHDPATCEICKKAAADDNPHP